MSKHLVKSINPLAEGKPCQHKYNGYWVVKKRGGYYCFKSPSSQFGKDSWLMEVDGAAKEERIRSLRWFCLICNTLQMP